MTNFEKFSQIINYNFRNENLLLEALTHPSLTQEGKIHNYQRLEFLGDKVLSLAIGEFLMHKFPDEMEGALSRRHASLVSGEALAEIALEMNLDEFLLLSEGEEKLGGRHNKHNLENALEAVIGAIYLDSNFQEAQKFIMKFWHDFLLQDLDPPKDPVSKLQEIVQSQSRQLPEYIVVQSGGSHHAPLFTATVKIPKTNEEFSAEGKSKKEAQREAAKRALEKLDKENSV